MTEAEALAAYFQTLKSTLRDRLDGAGEGLSQEEAFTQYALDLLADSGEAENARTCWYGPTDRLDRRVMKLNGYALSEDYEKLLLVNALYRGGEEVGKVYKAEIETALNQTVRFLDAALKGELQNLGETEEAFDLARELFAHRKEIGQVELLVITNGDATTELPEDREVRGLPVQSRVISLRHLMQLAADEPEPIRVDFEALAGQPVPCLPVPYPNDDYQAYLAVVPGTVLAAVYKTYGARLLETNVRAFLQFKGSVNKGIRETILQQPQMFLAFNNGITATAEAVELTDLPGGGKALKAVRDLQIVNGGQTTATLLQTQLVNKADLAGVYVQMKLSVIQNREQKDHIVPLISRYANSQNKVTDADLTANSAFHREFEKLSRRLWAPPRPGHRQKTQWFYERARAQYEVALGRVPTPKGRERFKLENPKTQKLTKEDLAKFFNAWAGLPWVVVKGAQKNHAQFVASQKKGFLPDNVFFEDLIAKAIFFREAEKRYGVKPNAIGDLRSLTVPYTVAYLVYFLKDKHNRELDLYTIWKQQALSSALSEQLYHLMKQIEAALIGHAPGARVGEWAKKLECWEFIKTRNFTLDFSALQSDVLDPARAQVRYRETADDVARQELTQRNERLRSIPPVGWKRMEEWGRATQKLTPYQRDLLFNIGKAVRTGRSFQEAELKNGPELLDFVLTEAPGLFENLDDEPMPAEPDPVLLEPVTIETVRRMAEWDRRRRVLTPLAYEQLKQLAEGRKPLNEAARQRVRSTLRFLCKFGYPT
jgi:hypothetical protein